MRMLGFMMACFCAARLNRSSFHIKNFVSASVETTHCRMKNTDDTDFSLGQADIGNENSAHSASTDQIEIGSMSWRSLIERSSKRSRRIRGSNYVQFATVDPATNEPRCRTVVFRGFLALPMDHQLSVHCDGMPCVAKMITDMRSKKISQVTQHANDVAELLWWFPNSSEQFRILGDVVFVGGGQFPMDNDRSLKIARNEMWGNISDGARESFLSTAVPGADFTDDVLDLPPFKGGRDPSGMILPAPDNFLLMLLLPKKVDYLSLTNNYRQIDTRGDGRWESRRVVP